ncbi:MAG: histidine kinase [Deltaproteobacteria bacterium]|nr:histidine kinase [Deltaproteobacteria bacterium]
MSATEPAGPPPLRSTRPRTDIPTAVLVRSAVTGIVLGIVAILSPLGIRLCFGTIPLTSFVATAVGFTATLVVGVVPIVVVARAALSRGASLRLGFTLGMVASIPVMIASNLAMLAVQSAYPAFQILDPNEPRTVLFSVSTGLADAVPLLAAWAGLVLLPTMLRAHEDRQKELAAAKREAELLQLRAHLEPHFVLNTMNAIAGLVTEDPAQARELLGMLGDVFRDATDTASSHSVDAEVAWLRRFVAIHEMRFPEQLSVRWDIASDVGARVVPALILQPLVENALQHGALRVARGELTIRARSDEEGTLVMEVRDNGPGVGPRRLGGKGLALVEKRLALESAPGERLVLDLTREEGETVARIRLPRAREGASEAA